MTCCWSEPRTSSFCGSSSSCRTNDGSWMTGCFALCFLPLAHFLELLVGESVFLLWQPVSAGVREPAHSPSIPLGLIEAPLPNRAEGNEPRPLRLNQNCVIWPSAITLETSHISLWTLSNYRCCHGVTCDICLSKGERRIKWDRSSSAVSVSCSLLRQSSSVIKWRWLICIVFVWKYSHRLLKPPVTAEWVCFWWEAVSERCFTLSSLLFQNHLFDFSFSSDEY